MDERLPDMKRILCGACRRALDNDEVALNLKVGGRAASRFFCLPCLASRTGADEAELRKMTAFFKENGCELFERRYVDE